MISMSGHSRWAQIKHKKAGTDAKRGAAFSKLIRLITVAAREGGPDPEANFKLRQVMDQARAAGLPKDNIERAAARAKGSEETANLRAVEYEVYGPGGSAFLVSGLTDNPNRTTGEIKRLVDEYGGRLATAGSVAWMFERRIVVEFQVSPVRSKTPKASADVHTVRGDASNGARAHWTSNGVGREKTEETELALIDAGAEDVTIGDGLIRAVVPLENYDAFQETISPLALKLKSSVFTAVPKNTIGLNPDDQTKAETIIAALEDHPDINDIWTNIAEPS